MICPTCARVLRGRYCNDGHPMKRGRAMTEAEFEAWCAQQRDMLREVRRARVERQRAEGDREDDGTIRAAALLALAMTMGVGR